MAQAIRRMLGMGVSSDAFDTAIRDYGVAESAASYLRVLGIAVPAAIQGQSQ
jgi:hypothetical protein